MAFVSSMMDKRGKQLSNTPHWKTLKTNFESNLYAQNFLSVNSTDCTNIFDVTHKLILSQIIRFIRLLNLARLLQTTELDAGGAVPNMAQLLLLAIRLDWNGSYFLDNPHNQNYLTLSAIKSAMVQTGINGYISKRSNNDFF